MSHRPSRLCRTLNSILPRETAGKRILFYFLLFLSFPFFSFFVRFSPPFATSDKDYPLSNPTMVKVQRIMSMLSLSSLKKRKERKRKGRAKRKTDTSSQVIQHWSLSAPFVPCGACTSFDQYSHDPETRSDEAWRLGGMAQRTANSDHRRSS